MKELTLTNNNIKELEEAFNEIQIPRTPYALRELVVNTKFTDEFRYQQCVLELQVAYDNLRTAKLNAEIMELKISKIPDTDIGRLKRQVKEIELEQLNRARLGALREFQVLYDMFKNFKKYTRQEIDNAAELEFKFKLETQALHDINASGSVSVGNQEGLRQIGVSEIQLDNKIKKLIIENETNRIQET